MARGRQWVSGLVDRLKSCVLAMFRVKCICDVEMMMPGRKLNVSLELSGELELSI